MSLESAKNLPVAARSVRFHDLAESVLAEAGIAINGPNPWDIQVYHPRTFERMLVHGRLGVGEAYMDGWWDAEAVDEFVFRILRANINARVDKQRMLWAVAKARLFNLQRRGRAFTVGKAHYDLGNDLFEAMLDSRMTYTCGYWNDATTLEEAQEAKLDLVCRKAGLQPGMRVLDIGCGWGSFAQFAAERYGVEVVGITIAEEQVGLAKKRCAGLPVEIRLQDYRDLNGVYDRIVSLGMFEHVGYKNYRQYMEIVRRCLAPDGLMVLQTIGSRVSLATVDPWLGKYIFPNGMLPSISQMGKAVEGLFVLEDWHSFGADYDKTLTAWRENFEANWPQLRDRYDERFYRMWRYYLFYCAGSLRARFAQLWQIVLSPEGVVGGYRAPR